jgi:proline dehydrogenase
VDARLVKASQSTHRYIKTHAHEIRGYVERYCDIILELGNQKPMTDIVKEVFIENKAMALAERFAPQALPEQ